MRATAGRRRARRPAGPLALAAALAVAATGSRETPEPMAVRHPGASPGYTLFAPLHSTTAYLVDLEGLVVHEWRGRLPPGAAVHLTPAGTLLRSLRLPGGELFQGAGTGGRLEEVGWDGEVVWELDWAGPGHVQHHDFELLPSGNLLLLAWERKSRAEALAAGRDPRTVGEEGLWADYLVEIEPRRPRGGRVVWEWHAWDHLVQDRDPELPGYGSPADHPGRIDVNAGARAEPDAGPTDAEIDRLRALGYLAGRPGTGRAGARRRLRADWTHANAVDYHPELDQILLTVRHLDEIWVIDHGTTTAAAAGSMGGRRGRGGELLYRWGNPAAWGAGGPADRRLFAPHDAAWIPPGHPGAGNILLFNNGVGRPGGQRSSVDEIRPPLAADGTYRLAAGEAFGPPGPAWSHAPPGLFSARLSGAQRLPNGNTLICAGEQGRIFEVTPGGEKVWDYSSPFGHDGHQLARRPSPRDPLAGPPGFDAAAGRPPQFGYSLFRAIRLAPDHPGLPRLAPAARAAGGRS